jgi:hypothetical protein
VTHPGRFERLRHRANRFLIGMLAPHPPPLGGEELSEGDPHVKP